MPSDEEVTPRVGNVRSMTGLTAQEFQALLPPFEQAFVADMQAHTLDGQPRTVRRYRTYDTCLLPTVADKLLFLLTYVKQHPIQEVQGQLFGMSQAHADTWLHLLPAVLNEAFACHELLPARTANDFAVMLAAKRTEGVSTPPVWHDGTERPIHRPTDPEDPQAFYSGQQKCHTIKTLLVIDESCQSCFLSATYEGKANDKSFADLDGYTFPPGRCLYQAMGFQGYTCAGMTIVQPKKKPPGEAFSDGEREDTSLEGWDSRYCYGNVWWVA